VAVLGEEKISPLWLDVAVGVVFLTSQDAFASVAGVICGSV
jgi:hypothetical protein